MKLVRYKTGKPEYKGILENDKITRIDGSFFGEYSITSDSVSAENAAFLPPILSTHVIGLRGNYKNDNASPLFFMKSRSSLVGHNGTIIYPENVDKVAAEGELAIVLGKKCYKIKEKDAANYILGCTISNDITGKSSAFKESFTTGKWFDTFTPLGPAIDTNIDFSDLAIISRLNGNEVQRGSTKNMCFKPAYIIAYLSHIMTLDAGDVILTGTPSPSFELKKGDTIEIEIEGLGVLKNTVSI